MAAAVWDIEIDQGAEFDITFTYCDPSGTPIDVTGWTALLQLRTSPGSIVLLSLTDTGGITVGTTDGTFAVAMTAEQTAELDQDCRYDLLVTNSDAGKTRLVEGSASVDLAISVPA